MKKNVSVFIFIVVLFCASGAYAMNLEASLYANNSTVDARAAYLQNISHGLVEAGAEFTYKSDDYKIYGMDFGIRSDEFLPGSRYKLGFKGVYVDAEKNSRIDSQLTSIGFLLGINHDLSTKINPLSIPVSVGAEAFFSPEPLTWDDGEKYMEARANMNFHIMGNASIIIEYRYVNADFEDNGYDWEKEDHNFLFGYKLRF